MYFQINAKYDPELAHQCLEWIKDSINGSLGPDEDAIDFNTNGEAFHFGKVLQDGMILAR